MCYALPPKRRRSNTNDEGDEEEDDEGDEAGLEDAVAEAEEAEESELFDLEAASKLLIDDIEIETEDEALAEEESTPVQETGSIAQDEPEAADDLSYIDADLREELKQFERDLNAAAASDPKAKNRATGVFRSEPIADYETALSAMKEAYGGLLGEQISVEEEKPSEPITGNIVLADEVRLPAINKQGYQSFEMDGLELLVGVTADGKLSLADSYVFESSKDLFYQPRFQGQIPTEAIMYQAVPWEGQALPDTVKGKAGYKKLLKVIFVPVLSFKPYQLDFRSVYIFDGESRCLSAEAVTRVGPDLHDPVLRIRADGVVTVEDTRFCPQPAEVAMAAVQKREPEHQIDPELLEQLEREVEEYGSEPDVPASDF